MKDDTTSSTALTVLQGILYIADKPELSRLVSREMRDACEKMLASSEEGKKRIRQLRSRFFRILVPLFERLMLPGITLHYVLRKKYIEEIANEAIRDGFTQIVNLGAGLDTLLYRLSAHRKDIRFIEVDHPATGRLKQDFIQNSQSNVENFYLLPVDFTKDDPEEKLSQFPPFQKNKPTFYILEGVTMYLSEQEVRFLFQSLRRISGSKIRIAFTFLHGSNTKYSRGPLLSLYLWFRGEPLYWKMKQEELADFLKSVGYELMDIADSRTMRERYLPGGSRVVSNESESIAVAGSTGERIHE